MGSVGGRRASGRPVVLKLGRVLPGPHGEVVAPVLPGPDAALVVDMTVEMNDVIDLDGRGERAALLQGLAVNGEGLGQEEGPLVFPVQLEVDDGLVGIGDFFDHPGAVEVISVRTGRVGHVSCLFSGTGTCSRSTWRVFSRPFASSERE